MSTFIRAGDASAPPPYDGSVSAIRTRVHHLPEPTLGGGRQVALRPRAGADSRSSSTCPASCRWLRRHSIAPRRSTSTRSSRAYSRYEPERWRQSFIRRIFGALEIDGNGPYLDVGVGGSGATVVEAARAGTPAVGCDLSIEGVVQARRFAVAEGVREAEFVACAAESLPFPDSSFACASSVAVLEHIDDDAVAARELARVLRPGGLLWITVPNAYRHIPVPLRPVYRRHDRMLGHKRHYALRDLVHLLSRAGFAHVCTEYSGHPVKVAQLVLDRLVPQARGLRSRVWWKLEDVDLRQGHLARHALQLSAVFRRT